MGNDMSMGTTDATTAAATAAAAAATSNGGAASSSDKPVKMEGSAASFGRSAVPKRSKKSGKGHSSTSATPIITDEMQDVRIDYHINTGEIGHGHYSVVRKCMHRQTKEWFAVKSILKSKVSKVEVLKREIRILQEMNHPNIIKLVEVKEDEKYLHLITELCTGGELFDRIIAKTQSKEGHFSEHDAAKLVQSILDAIDYCHEKHIVHRDLKPENFLFLTKAEDSPIKIIDFGLSRHDTQNYGVMKTRVGTPYYVAPEVLNREYQKSCDIWSIGVITYILLCGYPPFFGDSDGQIFDSIRQGSFDFPSPDWDDISGAAKDFICCLLRKESSQRPTAKQAMNHKWLRDQLAEDDVQRRKVIGVSHVNERSLEYKKLRAMQKLKKAALRDIATHLSKAEIGSLGDTFRSIDKDGDGVMSLKDLDSALTNGSFPAGVHQDLRHLRRDLSLSGEDTLNWRDFLAGTMDKHLAMREDKIRMAFEDFKKSDDNCLLVSDLVDIFGGEGPAKEIMGYVDTDGDGRISFEEFRKAIEESMEEEDEFMPSSSSSK